MLPARRKRAAAEIRTSLDTMRAQRDLAEAFASHYTEATTLLISWHEWLQEIEQTNNLALKHQVIELLVGGISAGYYQRLSGTYSVPRAACSTYRRRRLVTRSRRFFARRGVTSKMRCRSV